MGETAAEVVRAEFACGPTRRRGPDGIDPVKLLVWAGAAEEARVTAVKEVIEDLSLGSRQMLERRLELLETAELVATSETTPAVPGRRVHSSWSTPASAISRPTNRPNWYSARAGRSYANEQ